jgi:hypothetical protein
MVEVVASMGLVVGRRSSFFPSLLNAIVAHLAREPAVAGSVPPPGALPWRPSMTRRSRSSSSKQ